MTKKNSLKKALITSALSMVLCSSMLVGTTYAWFTDSVTSTGNVIKTGTLDVSMSWAEGNEVPENATWTDASKGAIFNNNKWEPGHVEAKHIKIENDGTLDLKYELSIVPNGEVDDLADVIDVYLIEGAKQIDDRADLANVTPNGTLRDLINGGISAGTILVENESTPALESVQTFTLVLKMREEAGNEYQDMSIGTTFSVQLLATQLASEKDSIGPDYDENAPFSMWDGTIPTEMPKTLVVDGTTTTVHVKDAAAFVYLSTLSSEWRNLYTDGNGSDYTNYRNGAGVNYYYSGLWTISLEADIDLGNYQIDPVSVVLAQNTGYSTFNGNNHTIRNINATTGLFADGNRASYSNLKLMNVTATRGALAGSPRSSITNVTVKNATISGENYVGGLVGSAYSSVTNCTVEDSSVIGTGKEVGGLIGYIETTTTGTPAEVRGNIVSNVSVYAGNRAAGLVAQVNNRVKVYNNTINTVTVGAADTATYAADAVISNRITAAENVYDNTVTKVNVVSSVAFAKDGTELTAALAAGGNVVLAADVALTEGVTVAAGADVTLDLNGKTLSYNSNVAEGNSAINNKGTLTLTNGTVTYKSTAPSTNNGYATNAITNSGTLTIDGATVINTTEAGPSYAIESVPGSTLVVNSGKIESAKVAIRVREGSDVTINGGEVVSTGNGYAVQIYLLQGNFDTKLTINGGTLTGGQYGDYCLALYSYAAANGAFARTTVTITGGTFNGDVGFGGGKKDAKETVAISGGTFNGEVGRYTDTAEGWEDIAH